jgi:hypothetical protein
MMMMWPQRQCCLLYTSDLGPELHFPLMLLRRKLALLMLLWLLLMLLLLLLLR